MPAGEGGSRITGSPFVRNDRKSPRAVRQEGQDGCRREHIAPGRPCGYPAGKMKHLQHLPPGSIVSDFKPGLEGVIAFETEIAEPDKAGGALRYRGVDIEDLIGQVSFGNVWGLLVDGRFGPGLPPAEPFPVPVHSGDIRVDVQSAVAMLAPYWGLGQLLDIDDAQVREDLARVSVTALSFVAQSA